MGRGLGQTHQKTHEHTIKRTQKDQQNHEHSSENKKGVQTHNKPMEIKG